MYRHIASLIALVFCASNAFGEIIAQNGQAPLGDGDRLALIIANADYLGSSLDLQAPANDAELLDETLSSLGFETTIIQNADRAQMELAVQTFRDALDQASEGSVGLFYYSGHGVALSRGDDYLLGVDSEYRYREDIVLEAVSYQTIVSKFADLGGKGLILAMDTNRIVANLPSSTRGFTKGFVEVVPPEMFEIWASQNGDPATDVAGPDGVLLSPFSQALADALEIPGADIREVFARVQSKVLELTEGNQYPEVLITTPATLTLNNAVATNNETKSVTPPLVLSSGSLASANASLELTLWEAAIELGTADAIRDFLTKFPDSVLSGNAKLRLEALEARPEQPNEIASELAVLTPTVSYPGPKRVGLLIGNKSYAPNLNDLTNPHNDVDLIAERLRSIGFTVVLIQDATSASMVEGLSKFLTLLTPGAEGERPISFFYYSGHGFAPENSGKNYLVPVGLELNSETDLLRALTIESVVEKVQALSPAFSFYAFDACRNDPGLPSSAVGGDAKSTDGTKGFTPVRLASHSLIAYATALGEKAYDTPDAETGPYAQALASALAEPGLDASVVFKRAQRAAYHASGERQVPWIADGLIDELVLNDPSVLTAAE